MSTKHDSIGGPYIPFAYQTEILNASSDLSVREIILMTSAQVAKTWSMLIIAAHRIATRPSGIVWAMDTKESVDFLSDSRFTPMVEESKILSSLVADKKYKSSKNTKSFKDFPGGWMRFVSATNARHLASAPAPLALGDEIDKWSSTKEGDPLSLLQARLKMQINPLLVASSTPTIKGESKIEQLYLSSDQRRYYVPCIHCKKEHLLFFDNVEWESKKHNTPEEFKSEIHRLVGAGIRFFESKTTKYKLHFPDTAEIMCPECAGLISDYEKNIMVTQGRWIASRPFMGSAGFHLNELYSPKRTFSDIVLDYLKKKDDPDLKQVFVNATLGETWEIPHEKMKSDDLISRREHYYEEQPPDPDTGVVTIPKLPAGGAILTAGVDVQLDRIEVAVRLWGPSYESWGIEYLKIPGDPFQDHVWNELNNLLNKEYLHPNGMILCIQKCAIDTGYATDRVNNFVNNRKWPAVAVKGKGGPGVPVHNGTPTYANDLRVPLYTLGVDTIKNTLYQRSFIKRDGPGKIHWNHNFDEQYFKQYTNERRVEKKTAKGFVFVWELPPGKKNEPWDCEVYAYAGLHLIGMGDIEGTIKRILTPPAPVKEKKSVAPPPNTFSDDL